MSMLFCQKFFPLLADSTCPSRVNKVKYNAPNGWARRATTKKSDIMHGRRVASSYIPEHPNICPGLQSEGSVL